ncbi:hypothetical protein F5144DRAFT_578656 [Chaetomium tenue]|uniref:Uncharacterized protein n=1 Tax=Chaetomium tenue TaxID=1854479 RepID=A0ACB7P547_9PEZI|nr:hypothetical protein F5144DRAFT_578656 [Chaetomium globosum]
MADIDKELWVSGDEDEGYYDTEAAVPSADPTFFQLDLGRVGQKGGFHTRNAPGQKQREQVAGHTAGSKSRPAFYLGCEAKAIIHGTLNEKTGGLATLLVYDFSFFSYRSVRIKEADIHFEFRSKDGIAGAGPLVAEVAPSATHTMMRTNSTVTRTGEFSGGLSGGAVVTAQGGAKFSKTVEMEESYAVEVTGNRPADDFGNRYQASWSMRENTAQQKGIMRQFRACILLERETDDEFQLIPTIEARPNFTTWVATLFSSRTPDDPVLFDPQFEPLNALDTEIDQWNLEDAPIDKLWDCTFHHSFADAVKDSRTGVSIKGA